MNVFLNNFVELVYSPQESRALVGVPVMPTTMTFSSHDLDSYIPEVSLLLKTRESRLVKFFEANQIYIPSNECVGSEGECAIHKLSILVVK